MGSLVSKVIKAERRRDLFSVLHELDTRSTGNNAADLGEIEPELRCEL
jgi:hypothetical protein